MIIDLRKSARILINLLKKLIFGYCLILEQLVYVNRAQLSDLYELRVIRKARAILV